MYLPLLDTYRVNTVRASNQLGFIDGLQCNERRLAQDVGHDPQAFDEIESR
jgi:hypothetical protein